MLQNILFSLNIVAPVFLIVVLGVWLKRKKMIDDHFNKIASKQVFHVTMPALVFSKIAEIKFTEVFNPKLILFTYAGIGFAFMVSWLVGSLVTHNGRDRGAFIQGSFRGNFAILGFAMIQSAFGKEPLASAAVLLSCIMPPYNLLSIIALTIPQKKDRHIPWAHTVKEIATNPLIWAAAVALPFSLLSIPVPKAVFSAIDQLASLTLPLALIGIGSSLSFTSIKTDLRLSVISSIIKLVVSPTLILLVAVNLSFTSHDLAVLFFFFASPAAIASYIMAEAMGSNGRLAGNIVLLSTLASALSLATGIFILRTLGYF